MSEMAASAMACTGYIASCSSDIHAKSSWSAEAICSKTGLSTAQAVDSVTSSLTAGMACVMKSISKAEAPAAGTAVQKQTLRVQRQPAGTPCALTSLHCDAVVQLQSDAAQAELHGIK